MKTVVVLLCLLIGNSALALVGDLQLQITNLRSNKGSILISVFKGSDGFPKDPMKAIKKMRVNISQANKIVIKDLDYGDYAVAMVHDENNNGMIDTGLFGIPKEGIGFSRNPGINFGPPDYNESAFALQAPVVSTFIKVKYY